MILGSSAQGIVEPQSDVDIAVFLNCSPRSEILMRIVDVVERVVPGVEIDLGILNGNEPVYRFESLKGKLLFTRNQESWLHFFSLTCREYEHWLYHYEKQRRYRMELYAER